jgi:hypothetical protein
MLAFDAPAVNHHVSSTGQVAESVLVVVALAIIAVAAVRLSRRWSTWLPVTVVIGTIWAAFFERTFNVTANLWYYQPGQVTLYRAFGGGLPVWVFFSYGAFYGGLGLLVWWLVERGATRRRVVQIAGYLWLAAAVTEIVNIHFGTYEYLGMQPFRLLKFPLWIPLTNVAICVAVGVGAARLRPLLTGKRIWATLFLCPAAIITGLAATTFPMINALHVDHPHMWLSYLAAIASMALAGTMVWVTTMAVPVEGLKDAANQPGRQPAIH